MTTQPSIFTGKPPSFSTPSPQANPAPARGPVAALAVDRAPFTSTATRPTQTSIRPLSPQSPSHRKAASSIASAANGASRSQRSEAWSGGRQPERTEPLPARRRPASQPVQQGARRTPPVQRKRSFHAGSPNPEVQDPHYDDPSEPKRTRLSIHNNHRLDLSGIDTRIKAAGEPPSPLFFSNTPKQRPPLPPRFSSSEAGAHMMKKAAVEDNASVRTVRMARGSVHLPISPHRAFPHHAPRASLDRSISRSMTPDEREAASNSIQALGGIGAFELLDHDDRVVFVVDLASRHLYSPGPLNPIFANRALRSFSSLLDLACGRFKEDSSALLGPTASFPEFKSWLTSFVKDYEARDVIMPSFTFLGVNWSASTLRKRFRIISGAITAETTRISSTPPSAVIVDELPVMSRPLRTAPVQRTAEEPRDYFGNIEVTMKSPTPSEVFPSRSVVTSIETPSGPPPNSRALESPSGRSTHSTLPDAPPIRSRPTTSPKSESGKTQATTPANALIKTTTPSVDQGFFDWTRMGVTSALPKHIQFTRSIDWASTALGPIESWPSNLRSMCNLIMASPHPAAMYWGEELIAIYNEPYIMLAGQKHPELMGMPYRVAWKEIWEDVKDSFSMAKTTGQSTMKDDDCLFMVRSGFLEETYFSWSLIPLVGDDGSVVGLYNPAFEKTRRKIAERRMLTLRAVGERTAAAREVRSFWGEVLQGLEDNEFDTPFVLLYSVADDSESDASSIHSHSGSMATARQCTLEGTLPAIIADHPAAPRDIDLKTGMEGFGPVFREAMTMDKPVLLEVANGTLDPKLIEGIDYRGFKEPPKAAVVCPIHPTTGDSIIGFLVMGINPRRPYDDDYNLFVQLLGRQLATSMASVVLFEEEIRRGQRAARLAALDRIELSEQLAARTQEAVESETKFTRMAAFAPVGMFIADNTGKMTFTNDAFHRIAMLPNQIGIESWMDAVHDDDRDGLLKKWDDLIQQCKPLSLEFRFKAPWMDRNGTKQANWVIGNAYPERNDDDQLKTVFGTITNISQQKLAEEYQRRRMEEAVELKRQQTNFMDMTSHEMRNPLSAILQCAEEISNSLSDFQADPGEYQLPNSLIDSNIDAAQTIALCANHQTRIVSDVLTLSKLDAALLLVTPVDVKPAQIVQQALKMFDGELQTADIRMQFVIDKTLEAMQINWVRLDPSRLLQVLINLTTNAIKFTTTQAKRTIVVTLSATTEPPSRNQEAGVDYIHSSSRKDDITNSKDWGEGEVIYLHFSVRDTGKGLTESERKLLFLRFSQANPKTHVQYGGSGLGLFISRELVELQGGEIGVASESGKGSTFAFYVKARRSSGPKDGGDEVRVPGSNRKPSLSKQTKPPLNLLTKNGKRSSGGTALALDRLAILIVEDNLVNQRVLSKQLKNLGCIVYVANHGGECIEHLQKSKFWSGHDHDGVDTHVILMDLEMPIMDGLTCTRKIREYQKTGEISGHIPIIAVSANARDVHINGALEAGMDDVVSKPFRIPELLPKIEQLMVRYGQPVFTQKATDTPTSSIMGDVPSDGGS